MTFLNVNFKLPLLLESVFEVYGSGVLFLPEERVFAMKRLLSVLSVFAIASVALEQANGNIIYTINNNPRSFNN